jgi:hypothetical protein
VICLFRRLEARRDSGRTKLDQAPRRLNDLLQAVGDLEVAERIRRQPFEIVEFIIQARLPGGPACRE